MRYWQAGMIGTPFTELTILALNVSKLIGSFSVDFATDASPNVGMYDYLVFFTTFLRLKMKVIKISVCFVIF